METLNYESGADRRRKLRRTRLLAVCRLLIFGTAAVGVFAAVFFVCLHHFASSNQRKFLLTVINDSGQQMTDAGFLGRYDQPVITVGNVAAGQSHTSTVTCEVGDWPTNFLYGTGGTTYYIPVYKAIQDKGVWTITVTSWKATFTCDGLTKSFAASTQPIHPEWTGAATYGSRMPGAIPGR